MNTPPAFHIIIPARLSSSRLPKKMLADLGGVPLIVRTAQQAAQAGAISLTIAVDDELIAKAVQTHGFTSVLTDSSHLTGTDRLAQAIDLLNLDDKAIVVNVQGDEPLIPPDLITAVARALSNQPDCVMATAAHALTDASDIFNPNTVKVVCNSAQQALYFSRAPIPFAREAVQHDVATGLMQAAYVSSGVPTQVAMVQRHIGIYAYRASFLRSYPHLTISPLETIEHLEQLRVLWHGYKIAVLSWQGAIAHGVDTLADLVQARNNWAAQQV